MAQSGNRSQSQIAFFMQKDFVITQYLRELVWLRCSFRYHTKLPKHFEMPPQSRIRNGLIALPYTAQESVAHSLVNILDAPTVMLKPAAKLLQDANMFANGYDIESLFIYLNNVRINIGSQRAKRAGSTLKRTRCIVEGEAVLSVGNIRVIRFVKR